MKHFIYYVCTKGQWKLAAFRRYRGNIRHIKHRNFLFKKNPLFCRFDCGIQKTSHWITSSGFWKPNRNLSFLILSSHRYFFPYVVSFLEVFRKKKHFTTHIRISHCFDWLTITLCKEWRLRWLELTRNLRLRSLILRKLRSWIQIPRRMLMLARAIAFFFFFFCMPCEWQIPGSTLCLKDLLIRNVALNRPESVIDKGWGGEEEEENCGGAGVKVKQSYPCNKPGTLEAYRVVRGQVSQVV
jgi:hypothetical protein